jgi:DUF4097 and DUF4098 domain-containing protein YvlB
MGTPPQYPPQNPQYQPPQDPRRQVRDWARAQRDQARAQRQYWRYYWRAGRRGSITGPIILLTVGILALLVEAGRLNGYAIWNWYAQWWPLLLIVVGLISLAEYFFDRDDPYARRRTGGGFVFLFVLLVLLGLGAHGARRWSRQFGDDNDFGFMFGEEHDNDIAIEQAAAANGTVNVQDPRGGVSVTPSSDGQIHLRAHEVVHTSSDEQAHKEFDEIRPRLTASGSSTTINVPGRSAAGVDLTLEVPESSFVVINAGHGDVSVEGLKNNAEVTAGHGDVKFDNMGGDVHARMSEGDFSAHAIGGQVFVNGHADDVTLSEVKGQAVLDGEFFGDTHLEQMGGPVHFHSTRTQIDVPKLGGDLTLDSDDLSANQTGGPVRIVTHAKNIELTQTTGDLHIEDGDGDVNVTAAAPLGNIEILGHTGALSLTVPENANFSVSANTTEDDDLETDFPLNVITNGDEKQVAGMVGKGGVKLDLSTTHGNLELRKGSADVASPGPEPSTAPSAPGRHLKAPKAPVTPTEQ